VGVDHLGPRSLRQLLDAVLAIGSELDLDRALQHIVEAAVALAGARYRTLGVPDEDKRSLAAFVTVGIDDASRRAIGDLPKGLGLAGADARADGCREPFQTRRLLGTTDGRASAVVTKPRSQQFVRTRTSAEVARR
jgi:hypothetical protein